MEKKTILWLSILIYVGFPIVTGIWLFLSPLASLQDLKIFLSPDAEFLKGVLLGLISFFHLFLFFRLLPRYRKKHSEVVLILMMQLLFTGLSTAASVFFVMFQTGVLPIDYYLNAIEEFFMFPGLFYLGWFTIEIYFKGIEEKRMKPWFASLWIFAAGLDIWMFLVGISVIDANNPVPYFINMAGSLVIMLTFTIASFKTAKKVTEAVPKKAFRYLGFSGPLYILGLIILPISMFSPSWVFSIFPLFILIAAAFFLYLGFTLPMGKE